MYYLLYVHKKVKGGKEVEILTKNKYMKHTYVVKERIADCKSVVAQEHECVIVNAMAVDSISTQRNEIIPECLSSLLNASRIWRSGIRKRLNTRFHIQNTV